MTDTRILSPVEPLLSISMESCLNDIQEFNSAMEGIDVKTMAHKAIEAGKAFLKKAGEKVRQVIDAILRRLGEMIGAIANMAHGKDIAVPSDLYKGYMEIRKIADDVTAKSEDYANTLTKAAAKFELDAGWYFSDDAKNRDELKDLIRKAADADVLKDMSAGEYISDKVEPEGRTAKINPRREQMGLSSMRGKWLQLKRKLNFESGIIGNMIDTAANSGKFTDAQVAGTRSFYGKVYSNSMIIITGMLNVIGRLQKYISVFIQINKKFPAITSDPIESVGRVVDEETKGSKSRESQGSPKALPA